MSVVQPDKCGHCGFIGRPPGVCPTIKAIEYFPDGMVKRIEYKTNTDYAIPAFEVSYQQDRMISPIVWWPTASGEWRKNV